MLIHDYLLFIKTVKKYFIFISKYSFIVARFYFPSSTSGNISNVVNYIRHLFSLKNYLCPEIIFSLFSTVILGQSKLNIARHKRKLIYSKSIMLQRNKVWWNLTIHSRGARECLFLSSSDLN